MLINLGNPQKESSSLSRIADEKIKFPTEGHFELFKNGKNMNLPVKSMNIMNKNKVTQIWRNHIFLGRHGSLNNKNRFNKKSKF